MITRMEITYRSENPCNIKPEIFTTGGYTITNNGNDIHFDFEDMYADFRFENDYLYIDALQKNIDETVLENISSEELDKILRSVKKKDFTDIYYECFGDKEEQHFISLIPESIVFYDFSEEAEMLPVKVQGTGFVNITNGKHLRNGGFLIEMLMATDGDFNYKLLPEFKPVELHDEIFIADLKTAEDALKLIKHQILSIVETIKGKDYVVSDIRKIMLEKLNFITNSEKECINELHSDSGSISIKWNNGNQYGYFRLKKHNSENIYETYNKIKELLGEIGVHDVSMLFAYHYI